LKRPLLFFSLLCSISVFAQKDSTKKYDPTYISISGGGGFPINYKYAFTGFNANIFIDIPLYLTSGFTGLIGYSYNSLNMTDYLGTTIYQLNNTPFYSLYTFLPGLYIRDESDKNEISGRALVGMIICKTPYMSFSTGASSDNIASTFVYEFAFDLGFTQKYFITKKFWLNSGIDFLYTKLNNYAVVDSGNGLTTNRYGPFTVTTVNSLPIALINVTLGLSYQL
jgi:hypothetical protein